MCNCLQVLKSAVKFEQKQQNLIVGLCQRQNDGSVTGGQISPS